MTTNSFLPSGESDTDQWYNLSMDFRLDNYTVDWDELDHERLLYALGRLLALLLVASDAKNFGYPKGQVVTAVRSLQIKEIDFISDEELESWLEDL